MSIDIMLMIYGAIVISGLFCVMAILLFYDDEKKKLLLLKNQRIYRGECPDCGYTMFKLPTPRCPECGQKHEEAWLNVNIRKASEDQTIKYLQEITQENLPLNFNENSLAIFKEDYEIPTVLREKIFKLELP